jgi:hypothetical protein
MVTLMGKKIRHWAHHAKKYEFTAQFPRVAKQLNVKAVATAMQATRR